MKRYITCPNCKRGIACVECTDKTERIKGKCGLCGKLWEWVAGKARVVFNQEVDK